MAVVVVVVVSSGSAPAGTAGNSGAAVTGATIVQRRDLVETDTESGTLSYANPQTVYNRLSGTITWLPAVGQEIRPGGTLYDVDREPVILMSGTTPAYRDLDGDDSPGPDIEQLNRNLVTLGFNPDGITVDDTWQAATSAGVEVFQESLGEVPTGDLSLGQIVFLPGAQLVNAVDGTLGSTASGGGSPAQPAAADADAPVDPAAPEFVSLITPASSTATTSATATSTTAPETTTGASGSTTTTPTTTPTTTTSSTTAAGSRTSTTVGRHPSAPTSAQTLAALVALLKAEIAQLKAAHSLAPAAAQSSSGSSSPTSSGSSSPKSSGSSSPKSSTTTTTTTSSSGAGGTPGSSSDAGGGANAVAILQTTSTQLVVTVDLAATVQSEAVVGEHVTVELPAGSTVNGRITAVSAVAQSSSGSGGSGGSGAGGSGGSGGAGSGSGSGSGSSTIPVTITLSGHHTGAGLDQAAVSVDFVQQRANNVLSVPVTALLATSGQSYAVQEATAPHQLIPVTTGLFAAGYVQISGPGIYSGLQVTDSQG